MECKRVMTGFLICTGLSISAFSQTTGKIIDTKQQPIEGATIVMQLPDSTYLGAAISAADGTFTLEQEPEWLFAHSSTPALPNQTGKGADSRCRHHYAGAERL